MSSSQQPQRPWRIVLASSSPSRLVLLRAAGFDPEVIPSHVDEDDIAGLTVEEAARLLAARKAHAVADRLPAEPAPEGSSGGAVVVGCDSLLSIDGQVRGKPASVDEARDWWRSQSGKLGTLVTGHCVVLVPDGRHASRVAEPDRRQASGVAQTDVRFGEPTDPEIEAYLATGEPLQVAGAATIDGYGAPFIDGIDGDHGTVVGLSLPLLRRLLAEVGVAITDLWAPPP